MAKEIENELKKILGDDAFSIGNMQVSDRVQKLVKTVNYLVTQLKISGDLSDGEDCKRHIDKVIFNAKEMLS